MVYIVTNKTSWIIEWHHLGIYTYQFFRFNFFIKWLSLKCYYLSFNIFLYTVICWGWKENFPRKWMTWIIFQIINKLWIFISIFMFFPLNLYVTSGLANVWFFTSACGFVNHAWWMWIFTFKLKQLLDLLLLWSTLCICPISHQWNCKTF